VAVLSLFVEVGVGDSVVRCKWASNELNIPYHDAEWGVPVHDDRRWFEFLLLEGAQAGLSWDTILRKRERYRKLFSDFDAAKVARYDAARIRKVLGDAGIVRNKLKVHGAVQNARAFVALQEERGSFDAYVWEFVGGKPIVNRWRTHGEVPAQTALSEALSKDLRRRGFTFVGPTIVYALMQATGLVNDHLVGCFRYREIAAGKQRGGVPCG
jgi:DNA-3-methyladenine glycosylase I